MKQTLSCTTSTLQHNNPKDGYTHERTVRKKTGGAQ